MDSRDPGHRDAAAPPDVEGAHRHSSLHRVELGESGICGCFCCCSTFPPSEIREWADEAAGRGRTALCPRCGIDSVIGDRSGYPITTEFLQTMRAYWF